MKFEKERKSILDTGLLLVKHGLVARTWGNVSIRIDDEYMLITPSGLSYDDTKIEDIVVVNYHTMKHEGNRKPSSEKKLHGEIYRIRQDINAVIHTHQMKASIFATARKSVSVPLQYQAIINGEMVHAAPYHLPNSKKISTDTVKYLGNSNAALMSNHGAVCVGKDLDKALEASLILELICEEALR